MRGKQGKKDNKSKRVNFDNVRDSKVEDVIKDIRETKASNDVSWYANNPELLRSAASIPFSVTTGLTLPFKASDSNQYYQTVPGVMALNWLPSIGGREDTAVNAAKDSIYSFVVHANSRNTSYNATDLMMVILSAGQVFAMLANGIRAYGTMRLYDQRNAYLPKALIRAMGFDFNDLQNNLSNMWFDLNEIIARCSQIWVPKNLPFIERWFWLNSHIYMDSESVKGQYYLFNQRNFLGYNEKQTPQGGGLSWMTAQGNFANDSISNIFTMNANNPATWAQFKTVLNAMIKYLVDSEDRGIIMGDILKAYGAGNLYSLAPVSVDYQVAPVYDREVLTQIENCCPYEGIYKDIEQEQTTLSIFTQWVYTRSGVVSAGIRPMNTAVLNFHQVENPTPEQVMVATRLRPSGFTQFSGGSGTLVTTAVFPVTLGTEYIYDIHVVNLTPYGASNTYTINKFTTKFLATETIPSVNYYIQMAFDWCPWVYIIDDVVRNFNSGAISYEVPETVAAFGDWDYYTTTSPELMKKLNTTAVFGEFGVPVL